MSNWKTTIAQGAAQIQIALICKQIVQTKWYQWSKRRKLLSKASTIADKHNIEF